MTPSLHAPEGLNPGELDAPQTFSDLVRQATAAGASDIHLQMRGAHAEVAFRLDGVITPVTTLVSPLAERVFGRIKFLARLKTYQDSLPQDGRIEHAALGSPQDIRVATYPTVTGEKIVLRLFNFAAVKTIRELAIPEDAGDELASFLRQSAGLLLLTGPAGSGKTTTIYACLQHLLQLGGRHIITVEDPVEQIIPGIMQTEINEAVGLGFARAARHLLRQDPQALILGEIRDEETANLAVRAALTGHLVISTLHAGSCRGVLERLLTLCPDLSAVAAAVELIFNQRLIRRTCDECGGERCAKCFQTGYLGRIPVVEWLRVTDDLRAKLRTRDLQTIQPRRPLAESARDLLRQGQSNEVELQRVLGL